MFAMLLGAGLVVAGTVVIVRHRHGMHRTALGCALRRIKATDAQKQRLYALFDDAQARLSPIRERACAFQRDLAAIIADATIEPARLETLESQLFEVLGEGTQVLRDILVRVHETLEPKQREQLTAILRQNHRRQHQCHPFACNS
jgi:Spy/CpxP family protein refolding chaperone